MTIFKPMLSGKCEDITKVTLPVLASPKLDGIRCVMRDGVAMSRNLKPIPNKFIQHMLEGLDNLDGELIVGAPTGNDVWNRSQSGVMSADGEPDFTYHVFDIVPTISTEWQFSQRYRQALKVVYGIDSPFVQVVPHTAIHNLEMLNQYEAEQVAAGYEGIMIRSYHGLYKFGRSTAREGSLLKVKRFEDAEARVIGIIERMHNANEATKDALGRTKRTTHKANKVAMGTLGALVCEGVFGGDPVRFEIGTGFTDAQRAGIWADGDLTRDEVVKFKYQGLTPDGVPRFPVFLGWRGAGDMSDEAV